LLQDALALPAPPEFAEREQLASVRHRGGLNAYAVAWAVFRLEQELRDRFVERVAIQLYEPGALGTDVQRLARILHELFILVLAADIDFEFRAVDLRSMASQAGAHRPTLDASAVCLFSGGVDSFSGILRARRAESAVLGASFAHADQSRIGGIIDALSTKYLQPEGVGVRTLRAPRIGSGGYAQLRGFFYIVAAGVWLQLTNSSRLIVTECGPTMYQPRFAPLDSITMTTHPAVVSLANDALDALLGRHIEIEVPFSDLTKAEVMAVCPRPVGLPETHSCISQRFGRHDGTCHGCVLRRLAAIAADVPDVSYDRDPLTNPDANAGNLLSLLAFCADVLVRPDEMPEYQLGLIRELGKLELFRRFSLDNFGALHLISRRKMRLRGDVGALYRYVRQNIGADVLNERLATVRKARPVQRSKRSSSTEAE